MIKKISLAFLAYGDEHINECIFLINSLIQYNNLNFIVATDKPNKFTNHLINIIPITENFNYNLKKNALQEALNQSDISIIMDTDILVNNKKIDFSLLYDIPEGMYVTWRNKNVYFMNKKISVNDKTEYFNKLNNINDSNISLQFIDEYFIILKILDENKKNIFIENWNKYYEETKNIQPNNGKLGAIEGLIIYLSAIKSDLNIYDIRDYQNLSVFTKNFYHYNKEYNKCDIFKKKLI